MSHRRKSGDLKRLKRTYSATKNGWGAGVYYDEDKKRLIRYSPSKKSSRPRYLRNQANRKVRKTLTALHHGQYRKIYDYWWELW